MNRTQAANQYAKALAIWNVAASGSDEAAFIAADADLSAARAALAAAEIESPTARESFKASRINALRNRGLEVSARFG